MDILRSFGGMRRLAPAALAACWLAFPAPARAADGAAPAAEPDGAGGAAAERDEETAAGSFSGEIVVTATRTERPLDKLPISVTVLDRAAVEAAPARHLDDLLRTVPGINMPLVSSAAQSPSLDLVSMRGLGGSRALVLLDGVPLNDPFLGFVPWARVPAGSVERIEVARGGASSLYGSYALGGTIHVASRPLAGGEREVRALYGSDQTRSLGVRWSETVGGRVAVGLEVEHDRTDGYMISPRDQRGATDVPSAGESVNARLRARIDDLGAWSATLRGGFFADELINGSPLALKDRQVVDLAATLERPTARGGSVAASAFFVDGYYDSDNTRFVPGRGRDAEFLSGRQETDVRDVGASLVWSRPVDERFPLLVLGLDLRRISGVADAIELSQSGALTAHSNQGGVQLTGGLFAETSWFPHPDLEVLASLRVDGWSHRDGWSIEEPGGEMPIEDSGGAELDPRLAVHYQASPGVGLRGAVYRAFRTPNLSELYRSFSTRSLRVLANPDLTPETLVGAEVGVDLARPRLRGQLNLFHNEIDDLIGRAPIAFEPQLVLELANLGAARSRGLEAMATLDLGGGWSADAGYAFTDTEIREEPTAPELVGRRIPDVPRHAATLSLAYTRPGGLRATLRGRHVGEQFIDAANAQSLEAHQVLDASLLVPVPAVPGLRVLLLGENLTDEEYIAYARSTDRLGAPRQLFAGLRFGFGGG